MVIILLVGHLDFFDINEGQFQVIELYAGEQRMVKLAKGLGLNTASMDKDYDDGDNRSKNNSMDMNTCGGFLFLSLYDQHSFVDFVWL